MTLDVPPPRLADVDGPVAVREWPGPPGTTFVLVHGLGGASVNWAQVGPLLASTGRVLALDLPGFGDSPRRGRGSGLMDARRTLGGFLRSEAEGPSVLVGNSMGGVIGVLQAAVEPGSVTGLVLTGSAFPPVRWTMPHPAVMAGFALYDAPGIGRLAMQARFRRTDAERLVRLGFRLLAADSDSIPDDVVALTVEQVRAHSLDPDAVDAFLDAWRSLRRLGRRPDVARRAMSAVGCPVLVIHGGKDRLVPVTFARTALTAHPTWRGCIFGDLGHVPHMEAPGRWLTEVERWHHDEL